MFAAQILLHLKKLDHLATPVSLVQIEMNYKIIYTPCNGLFFSQIKI